MTVAAIGPVGSGGGAVYALSPYLNGVTRLSDAAAAAQTAAAAVATTAAAIATPPSLSAPAQTAAPATGATPFANPAIATIGQQAAVQTQLPPPASPTDSVLHGDAGELVQAYGAVALLAAPYALTPVYQQTFAPAIPPVAPVVAPARVVAPVTR